jgi:hypothetical protein
MVELVFDFDDIVTPIRAGPAWGMASQKMHCFTMKMWRSHHEMPEGKMRLSHCEMPGRVQLADS